MPSDSAAKTYGNTLMQGGSPRETEGRALLESARRMAEAQKSPEDVRSMKEIARLNWRLWTIFQAEVTQADCPLPPEVRKNMLDLCNFVDKHTVRLLANPEPKGFDVLISINRQIAAGLLTEAPAAAGGEASGGPEAPKGPSGPAVPSGGLSV